MCTIYRLSSLGCLKVSAYRNAGWKKNPCKDLLPNYLIITFAKLCTDTEASEKYKNWTCNNQVCCKSSNDA